MSNGIVARKALLSDVGPLLKLINDYASQGIMLARTEFELSENIRDFTVAVRGENVLGCAALHFYGPQTGEIRSLAVDPSETKHGVGTLLMESLEVEAAAHGLQSVFAFTYIPNFFGKQGFLEVDRHRLPSKVWKDCLRCPKLHCCDEIAMEKIFAVPEVDAPRGADDQWADAGSNGALVLPTVAKR